MPFSSTSPSMPSKADLKIEATLRTGSPSPSFCFSAMTLKGNLLHSSTCDLVNVGGTYLSRAGVDGLNPGKTTKFSSKLSIHLNVN